MLEQFRQAFPVSGGIHTPPETRLLLYALAVSLKARDILETGYDAGFTTLALAKSGARVIGVDNLTEYAGANKTATEMLADYDNVELKEMEAGQFMRDCPDGSFDLVFIDDNHSPHHVEKEAELVKRVLRPGGIAAFHDVNLNGIWAILERVFPDWEKINLPAYSAHAMPEGVPQNLGLGLVRKPTG